MEERKKSLLSLFRIFIKTSRNRVILTLVCSIIIFISITCFSLFAYNYRFDFYVNYLDENENYLNDGFVSAASSRTFVGNLSFSPTFMDEMTQEFSDITTSYFPSIEVENSTSLISAQVFKRIYSPYFGYEPENYKILTIDDKSYSIFNESLLEGRLPQNSSELALLRLGDVLDSVNDSITLYESEYMLQPQNFTIVGLVEIDPLKYTDAHVSHDIFIKDFHSETLFHDFYPTATFVTNFTMFSEIAAFYTYYIGLVEYMVDLEFDCDAIRISKLNDYLLSIPLASLFPTSELINYYVLSALDLNDLFLGFIEEWMAETIQIMALNIPLLLLIGIITGVVLNIGAKNLDSAYRRMKLHGLSYNNMRSMILLESSSFSVISIFTGVSIGLVINYSLITSRPERPPNYFVDFLQEPLLLLLIGTFFLGFIFMSYYTQNTIAKKASETISEEYKMKRTKFKQIFSTNEFRFFVFALIIALISIIFYFQFSGAETTSAISTNISYVTIFWFMISVSASILIVFVLLLIARLVTLMWSFISKIAWKRNINIGSLSIKHLTVSKKTYQMAILTALIFGVLVLPTAAIDYSVKQNLTREANLNVGSSDLAIVGWTDPEEERDYIFDNIAEIDNYTEVVYYQVISYYGSAIEPANTINLVGLENPEIFLDIINYDLMKDRSWKDENVLALKKPGTFLIDKKTSRKLDFKPGNFYYTDYFTKHYQNYTIEHRYNYFPCAPIPKKSIFNTDREVYTFVGSLESVKTITEDLNIAVGVRTLRFKLIKAINQSSVPIIKEKLSQESVIRANELYDINDMYNELYAEIDSFSKSNIVFYSILIFIVVGFVGYFTGLKAFEERGRIIEVLYRIGSEREKILGIFMFENLMINILPLTVAMLVSLSLIRVEQLYAFGLQEIYYSYKPGIPVWLFILLLLAGLACTTAGWLISMIPQIKRYRPVKQE